MSTVMEKPKQDRISELHRASNFNVNTINPLIFLGGMRRILVREEFEFSAILRYLTYSESRFGVYKMRFFSCRLSDLVDF